jgi:polyvinyl alcohol dehydrogenase (cytochrome)
MKAIFGKVAGLGFVALALICADAQAEPNGAELYARACAQCHDSSNTDIRAPKRDALGVMTPEAILRALQMGSMKPFASQLSTAEQKELATWVAGRGFAQQAAVAADHDGRCTMADGGVSFASIDGPGWNGWGAGPANTRFQGAQAAGLGADTVGRLRLKWAFGFAGALSAIGQPTVVGGRVFVGGASRKVHALDARTGCTHWSFTTDEAVRTAPSVGPRHKPDHGAPGFAVYFGDTAAQAYALDAASGALLWKVKVDPHRAARITGAPALHDGVLYVPVSSIEEAFAARADYECCTFRGSVVALDAETGTELWKSYTITDAPQPTKKNAVGTQQFGPAGAAVWSTPTIDAARGAIYVATGNAYSQPAAMASDAVIALDLRTGRRLWQRQLTADDAFVVGCLRQVANCPDDPGPDHDFGQSPILKTLADGRRILVIGQKSGVVHALDPDRLGEILWQVRVGNGGTLGGSQWGSAADDANVYVAISDVRFLNAPPRLDPRAGGGLFAIDLSTGLVKWSVPPMDCGERQQCSPALSAAVTALPGVVLSGGVSGWLRAYATDDGRLLWEVDTARDDYVTVNGVPGRGGAMDGPGPTVVDGMLYVTSGYIQWGGKYGNVVLAFGVGE